MARRVEKHQRIAVLCGGMSSEREVSLRSGKNCYDALQRLGYANSFMLDMDEKVAQRLVEEKTDVAFLALHGTYAEDGCIQGLLEILKIPYTGNGVAASAITWNKDLTKQMLKAAGLPVAPSITVKMAELNGKPPAFEFAYPVMVKPLAEGSSVGMSKVNEASDLRTALDVAGKYSTEVMVEAFVKGKSVTVGVVDVNGVPTVTPILELRTKTEWYDYEAKYTEGLTEFILPAELSPETTKAVQELTLEAHKVCGCHGVSRIDFVIPDVNSPRENCYILEINTIPGMTNLSDLPAQAGAMGISYDQLVEYLLQTALN